MIGTHVRIVFEWFIYLAFYLDMNRTSRALRGILLLLLLLRRRRLLLLFLLMMLQETLQFLRRHVSRQESLGSHGVREGSQDRR